MAYGLSRLCTYKAQSRAYGLWLIAYGRKNTGNASVDWRSAIDDTQGDASGDKR
jgi:hypothetical protein